MKKIILLASLAFSINAFAQVPSYVPTNGLQGWWPFSGNANDGSTNGYNGSVNGATLTTDRSSNANSAYNFNGTSSKITFPQIFTFNQSGDASLSIWINKGTLPNGQGTYLFSTLSTVDANRFNFFFNTQNNNRIDLDYRNPTTLHQLNISNNFINNSWKHVVYTRVGNVYNLYINGQFVNSSTDASPNLPTAIGWVLGADPTTIMDFTGKLDDIAVWNRALTQQEITDLYNAVNCATNTAITPLANYIATGSTATFTSTTSDPNPSYVWQSNFGQGFQTLNNFGNYTGANSSTLNITNVQLSEHNQPIRVISTSGNCIDTSNVVIINILDTCITSVTVYDTLLTTVTDTLVINATITGLNPPNNLNTIKVFPNPANDHITINYGNFASMSGYTLKITNNLGQVVFTTPINQQSSYIDLSTWSGNGIYFVQLIDPQNNTIENRKIVIQ